MIVTHFGNGDQIDQDVLRPILSQAAQQQGGVLTNFTIFPGANYGACSFDQESTAQKVMESDLMVYKNCFNA